MRVSEEESCAASNVESMPSVVEVVRCPVLVARHVNELDDLLRIEAEVADESEVVQDR